MQQGLTLSDKSITLSFSFNADSGHDKAHSIPLSIFGTSLGVLETVVLYLHDFQRMAFVKIAALINRHPKTVFTAYSQAKKKFPDQLRIEDQAERIPLSVFVNASLGPLEALAMYLHSTGKPVDAIAKSLDRNPQTIYTSLRRSRSKMMQISSLK
jgi:hypothetical protein